MVGLEGRAQAVIKRLEEEGKVTTLSRDRGVNFEHQIALAFAPVKEEFKHKHNASRAAVAKRESTSVEE